MQKFYSPLRYPGGKGKISPFFAQLFEENNLLGGTYIEPYVGGGSVALYLLMNNIVDDIIINDKDKSLYSFWFSILNYTDEFCQMIENTPVTLQTWNLQKEIQKNKDNEGLLTLGFSTFFLNRTNRSGIIKGGAIGGKKQDGKYLLNARYNKVALIERIKSISNFKDKIKLYNMDAVDLISTLIPTLNERSLFYFDPPYYIKGEGLYMNYYNDEDHINIRNVINLIKRQKWVITYDKVEFIKDLYKDRRIKEFSLNYSAAKVHKAFEYMIFSDNCIIPNDSLLGLSDINI